MQRTEHLPEGPDWLYEIKLDGYRALAIKNHSAVGLRSLTTISAAIVKALAAIPDGTVIDGEVVALDETGKPSFNLLQNYGSSRADVFCYVFDVLVLTAAMS